jgi:hypothetical protein
MAALTLLVHILLCSRRDGSVMPTRTVGFNGTAASFKDGAVPTMTDKLRGGKEWRDPRAASRVNSATRLPPRRS